MNRYWQKTLKETSAPKQEGETRNASEKGTELFIAQRSYESSKQTDRLMEEVCRNTNILNALQRVKQNKGSPGVDGMTTEELAAYLQRNWSMLKESLLSGSYRPQPVKRVSIPKPDGSMRELGIPTVLDRLIQQAILQVFQRYWEPSFSEHSYGFRPKRTMHQAISKAQAYIQQGYAYVVDIDLERFFDRVNHDMLMSTLAKRIEDKRLLKLIRRFLTAGVVMENGLVSVKEQGTPQGSPLSPLLSNIFLDRLDKELENRGHHFLRYADDCNIYASSRRAAERVMTQLCQLVEQTINNINGLRKFRTGVPLQFPGYRVDYLRCVVGF